MASQRRRLGIAQAQIHRPPLLILDEPAADRDDDGDEWTVTVGDADHVAATTWSGALVVALPLVGLLGNDLIVAGFPELVDALPWTVGQLTGAMLAHGGLVGFGPAVSAALLTGALVALAVWGLRRTEL